MPPQKKQRTRTNEKESSGAAPSARGAAARRSGGTSRPPAVKKERRARAPARTGRAAESSATRSAASEAAPRQAQESAPRVALPGDLYQRTRQWWWRVRLPGEDKAKARPLRERGAKEAVSDRAAAEKIAIAMWEQAVMQHGTRQITLECTAKVERLKAQFLDKVRELTDVVNIATARAEAEGQARADAEARLNALLQGAEQRPASPPAETPAQEQHAPAPTQGSAPVGESPCPSVPCALPETEEPAPNPGAPSAHQEDRPTTREVIFDAVETACTVPPAMPSAIENHDPSPQTGDCECCGAMDIPTANLERIGSGQRLCRECVHALHLDIARIEASTSADKRV